MAVFEGAVVDVDADDRDRNAESMLNQRRACLQKTILEPNVASLGTRADFGAKCAEEFVRNGSKFGALDKTDDREHDARMRGAKLRFGG